MKRYFIGIDGGGSKTTAVVADESGSIAASANGGSINFYSNPLEATRRNMADILLEIQRETGISSFEGAFIGMSALSGRATQQELSAFTHGVICADSVQMDSDLFIALEAMHTLEPCAVAISGTGSMVIARDGSGSITRAGGWGYILGDEGSGYAMSLAAIRAAVRAGEGAAPKTQLSERLLGFSNVSCFDELIDVFYNPPADRASIAAFLPVVRECAQEGDAVAREIIVDAAKDFSLTALALLKKYSSDIAVGLWGGAFEHTPIYRDTFIGCLSEKGFHNASLLKYPPQIGAVFAAYKLCNVPVTDEMLMSIIKGEQR